MKKPGPLPSACDAVVLGGGPAGATAATLLARDGHDVVLVERETFPRFKIGESLMPETYGTLAKLGMLDKLRESASVVKASVQFISASGKASRPFYFFEHKDHESAYTWQVERSWFDTALLDNASASGVDVRMATTATEVTFDDSGKAGGVKLSLPNGETTELRARVVIDATGLSSLVSRQLSLRVPNPDLNRASIFAHFENGTRGEGIDEGTTLVIHTPESWGWFWYIPLSDNRVSVGIVAPPDRLFGNGRAPADVLEAAIENCAPLATRLAEAKPISAPRVAKDYSYRAREIAGPGWVLVGDAFAFLDPIYSSGVFLALKSGEMAAESISAGLANEDLSPERLGAFGPELIRGTEAIGKLVHAFYTPGFSFAGFLRRHPRHRKPLIDLLIGDVFEREFDDFFIDLEDYLAHGIEADVCA